MELNDFTSVKAFVDRFEKEGGDLDLLVENAAVARFDYRMGNSGYEELYDLFHLRQSDSYDADVFSGFKSTIYPPLYLRCFYFRTS